MKNKLKFHISTTKIIILSFLLAIFVGSALLSLPISTKSGESVAYIDALFTSTTATCVTGLVTLPTATTWSVFGQIVILILIQIGGLGIINMMAFLLVMLSKKMGLYDSYLLGDAFNLNSISGISKFLKNVVIGTFVIEGIGALLYMTVFVPKFGLKGIWISVFNSISAFCNAGIDIIGENSLIPYATNPTVNLTTSFLIIMGGIGFIVWWDFIRVFKMWKTLKLKCLKRLTLHSKIAISATLALIFSGAILIFIFEYNNPSTIKDMSLFDKIQVSLFQSITTRTAGFATLPQESLSDASAATCLVLMFIGGSPVGTAGGVKTVTFIVLFATMYSVIKNKDEISIFNRNLSLQAIKKAVAVTSMSFIIMALSTVMLMASTNASALDILYETVSATATVGLTRNLTPFLNVFGKTVIILTMYFGRIGPISLFIAFSAKKPVINSIKNPTEEISVG